MEEMSPGAIAALGGLGGGMVLGFAARWGRFCTLGAIEDISLAGDSRRLRMWALAIAIAITGTFLLDQIGAINLAESFYLIHPTTLIATCVGGLLFGYGMSLVGTCGYGMLARVGGGDLKSVVTFLIMGISAYATMSGLTSYFRIGIFGKPEELQSPLGIAHLLQNNVGGGAHYWAYLIAIVIAIVCFRSVSFRSDFRYWTTSLMVGGAIVFGWLLTGYLSRDVFDPYPLESFTFSAPMGESILYIMTATGSSPNFGIGAVLGVVLGAAITARMQGYFRWEACDDAREMRRQILGGFLMGVGGVTALGCTVGQGMSAASLLAVSAPFALISMFIGAWIGLHILVHGSFIEPMKQFFSTQPHS